MITGKEQTIIVGIYLFSARSEYLDLKFVIEENTTSVC